MQQRSNYFSHPRKLLFWKTPAQKPLESILSTKDLILAFPNRTQNHVEAWWWVVLTQVALTMLTRSCKLVQVEHSTDWVFFCSLYCCCMGLQPFLWGTCGCVPPLASGDFVLLSCDLWRWENGFEQPYFLTVFEAGEEAWLFHLLSQHDRIQLWAVACCP